jgi:transcriptional regulator with XRE-family HTH domain
MNSKIKEKLQDFAYRTAFVASQINIGIPFQIKALMKMRGWTQEKLAERTGMLQPRISAILKPGKVRPNIETLRRIAEAFDCGLIVRFAPFSELAEWSESFDPESFNAPSFANDAGFATIPSQDKGEVKVKREAATLANVLVFPGGPQATKVMTSQTPSENRTRAAAMSGITPVGNNSTGAAWEIGVKNNGNSIDRMPMGPASHQANVLQGGATA